jgi:hypothetical protein
METNDIGLNDVSTQVRIGIREFSKSHAALLHSRERPIHCFFHVGGTAGSPRIIREPNQNAAE